MRALLFALMADGISTIDGPLVSPDTTAMIDAISALGARVEQSRNTITVEGTSARLKAPSDVIHCGNSGQVLRFIGALAGHLPTYTILTGDASIRTLRPAQPLIDALHQLGAFATSSCGNGFAPLIIRGPIRGQMASLDGRDSQPVSGLLMALSFADHSTELIVDDPGETPWIDLTLSWLNRWNFSVVHDEYRHYCIKGQGRLRAFQYTVAGDWSSALFPIAAAIVSRSQVTLGPLDISDAQGDKCVLGILQELGATVYREGLKNWETGKEAASIFQSGVSGHALEHAANEDEKLKAKPTPPEINFSITRGIAVEASQITVSAHQPLDGGAIDVDQCIDALPILAVIGCFGKAPLTLYNGKIARSKESDRIAAIAKELGRMGARIEEQDDGLIVYPSRLRGAELSSHNDHRIAMALAIAALGADTPSTLHNPECTAKSYPTFWQDLTQNNA
ncbi:MAG: hypothetical protein RL235_580 [Chlamydiota bacterium]